MALRGIRVFTLAAILCGLGSGTVAARTWRVPDGAPTIAAAIDSASAGDTVLLACGTYTEHDLVLKGGLTVRSEAGVAGCAVIDAQQQGRIFLAEDLAQTVVLQGLTLTGGFMGDLNTNGGAVYCRQASLNVLNCDFRDNYADYHGGGIFAHTSTLLVYNSTFTGNEGEHGGGGAAYLQATEGEFFNDRFEANAGIDGAGLFLTRCSPDVNFCTFVNNDGWFFGGAVLCIVDAFSHFNHCTLAGNEAYLGAGIMIAADSVPTLEACLIAFNRTGSGVYVDDAGSGATVRCTDVFGHEGGEYTGLIDDPTGTEGNISADPLFCDLDAGEVTLAAGSPCLPQGNDCLALMGANPQGCAPTPAEDVPGALACLHQNRPNPFNPQTVIAFTLTESASVDLCLYDLQGRLVTVLWQGPTGAGTHEVTWTGRDRGGRAMPSGTYLYRLRAGRWTETRAMQLVR